MGNPVLVEFLGLPGAGKSHISRLLVERLKHRGIPVRSTTLRMNHDMSRPRRILTKLSLSLWQLVRRPKGSLQAARVIINSRQARKWDSGMLWFNWMALAAINHRARSRSEVHIFDQGMVQLVWSVRLRSGEGSVDQLLPTRLGQRLHNLVIVVSAPLEQVEERLAGRIANSRIDRLEGKDAAHLLEHGQKVIDEIIGRAEVDSASDREFLTIMNDDDLSLAHGLEQVELRVLDMFAA